MAENPYLQYVRKPQIQPAPQQQAPTLPVAMPDPEKQQTADINQANTADEIRNRQAQLQLDYERNHRQNTDQINQIKTLMANGGVDTKEGQDRFAFHAQNFITNSAGLLEALKHDPKAAQPGMGEAIANSTLPESWGVANALRSGDRQQVNNSFRSMLESLIYLQTGAAAPPEQVERIASTIIPGYTDKSEGLIDKARRLQGIISAAKMAAGPANVKLQEALGNLDIHKLYNLPETVDLNNIGAEVAGEIGHTTGSDVNLHKLSPEAQHLHAQWLMQNPNGNVQDYIVLRQKLDKMSGIEASAYDPVVLEQYLKDQRDAIKSGGKIGSVPAQEEPKGALGKVAAAVSGSAPGTFAANFANAGGFGVPELLAGQEGRDALAATNEANPNAAIAGELFGSIGGASAAEKGLAAGVTHFAPNLLRGSRAAIAGDMAANSLYGGERGFNHAADGEGLSGTARGIAEGAGGTLLGHGVTRGVTPFLSEAKQAALAKLKGVDLTTLQRVGLGKWEEGIRRIYGVHGAKQGAVASMNVDDLNRGLQQLDGIVANPVRIPKDVPAGPEAQAYAADQVGKVYDAIYSQVGTSAAPPSLAADTAAIRLKLRGNRTQTTLWREEVKPALDHLTPDGQNFTGQSFKDSRERLGTLAADLRKKADSGQFPNSSAYRDMATYVEFLRNNTLPKMLEEVNPGLAKDLRSADKAYRHLKVTQDATKRALPNEGGLYSPSQRLSTNQKLDKSVDKNKFATGRAYDQDYSQAAADVMGPRTLGDISPEQNAGLGFGALWNKGVAATVGLPLAAGLYAPGVKRVTQAILTKRPKALTTRANRQAVTQALAAKRRTKKD